ncbi:hypothetical protein B296_00009101 [Ensete ventricosum]|uniref:Uncharacterized protein n=1 Tax=Ensete ventricosum TaxID=4639 RepID=A0A427AQG6_ENSVE|nr:hypothetical protein B296_00009101 [Ensete ventricosum]
MWIGRHPYEKRKPPYARKLRAMPHSVDPCSSVSQQWYQSQATRGRSSLQRGARRGSGVGRKDGRPLARRLPVGKGSCHLRRDNGDNSDTVRVKEG